MIKLMKSYEKIWDTFSLIKVKCSQTYHNTCMTTQLHFHKLNSLFLFLYLHFLKHSSLKNKKKTNFLTEFSNSDCFLKANQKGNNNELTIYSFGIRIFIIKKIEMQKNNIKYAIFLSAIIILLAQKCNSQGTYGHDCNNGNCRYCGAPDNCLICNAGFSLFRNTSLVIQRTECSKTNCSIPNCNLCQSLNQCW